MFTLEIKGRPIAVVIADEAQARGLFDDEAFQEDLRSMSSEGEQLWNGTDPLVVRPATKEEIEAAEANDEFEDDDWDDEGEGDDGGEFEDELVVLFLAPIDDDDDEDDLDDAGRGAPN